MVQDMLMYHSRLCHHPNVLDHLLFDKPSEDPVTRNDETREVELNRTSDSTPLHSQVPEPSAPNPTLYDPTPHTKKPP